MDLRRFIEQCCAVYKFLTTALLALTLVASVILQGEARYGFVLLEVLVIHVAMPLGLVFVILKIAYKALDWPMIGFTAICIAIWIYETI